MSTDKKMEAKRDFKDWSSHVYWFNICFSSRSLLISTWWY